MKLDELFSIRGKTALVTGATSGIGLMITEGLLRAGAKVYGCARGAPGVADARRILSGLGDLHLFSADVGTGQGSIEIRDMIAEREDKLHILVNNVGATHRAPLPDYPREEFDRVLNINITAAFDLTRVLLPLLRVAASGADPARVINISSVGALRLMKGVDNFAYAASKAGLNMLTRHMAAELAPNYVTVNAIAPGIFASKLSAYMFDPSHPRYHTRPQVPMDRAGNLEDIVGGVIYLSSRAGSYITGAMIPVSGGFGSADWGG